MIARFRLGAALACAATLSLSLPSSVARAQSSAPVKAGALSINTVWLREPPAGSRVAGGYMRITNTGPTPDRLVGGSVAFAKRFEVHEMTVTDGVMRMRELPKGLEIKPGETVELRPGGLHVMFVDVQERPKAGASVKGTLVFEKAGTVDVTYTVSPPGAPATKGGGHKHH